MFVHDGREPLRVVPFQQVRQFVDDDVFQTRRRFLGQFQIHPNAAGFNVAGAPLGFHFLDAKLIGTNAQDGLPFFQ